MLGQNRITKRNQNVCEERLLKDEVDGETVHHLHLLEIVLRATSALRLNERIIDEVHVGPANVLRGHRCAVTKARARIDVRTNPQTIRINLPTIGKRANQSQRLRVETTEALTHAVEDARRIDVAGDVRRQLGRLRLKQLGELAARAETRNGGRINSAMRYGPVLDLDTRTRPSLVSGNGRRCSRRAARYASAGLQLAVDLRHLLLNIRKFGGHALLGEFYPRLLHH